MRKRRLCGFYLLFQGYFERKFNEVIDRKYILHNALSIGINLRVLGETGVLLEFSYTLSKLESGLERHYCPKREQQYEFFDVAEAGIGKKSGRKNFLSDFIQNKALVDFDNTRSSLLGATRPEDK